MVLNETAINIPIEIVRNFIGIIAALGGVLFIYLIFSVLRYISDTKKYKKIEEISEKMDKLIKLLENKK